MAIRKPCETITMLTTSDMSDYQYHFVYQSGANKVALAGDTQNGEEYNVYILQNQPEANEYAELAVPGGQSLLKVVDASSSVGDDIMISTASKGTARVGSGKYTRAKVDEASDAANQIVVVNFVDPIYVTT